MGNSHDEIKRLLKASRTLLSNEKLNEDFNNIRGKYNILNEQSTITDRYDVAKSIEDEIVDDEEDEYETAETNDEGDEEDVDGDDGYHDDVACCLQQYADDGDEDRDMS